MSSLSLRHLYKVYPNGVKAVNDFNMEIEDKEFIVFVGPSGCGKSTTLRMIAGLEEITAGELYIGDQFVNHVEPKDRDIAMVFQNYALYPHMTVYENLAFGLQLRHVPQAEIHKKVLWAAKILKLEEYLERKPKALSGGQRQRVSLGRAILRTPKVFLLDEPLSNLDAKLRTEMRSQIAKLHNEIGTTFIYVTHDQVEAMTMGTRIVVMSMGYVQQIDTPQNLYNYPENKFVAGFIGTPQMNFFNAALLRKGEQVEIRFEGIEKSLTIPFEKMLKVDPGHLNGDRRVIVGLRCENITADTQKLTKNPNRLPMRISHFEELGNETLIYGDLDLSVSGLGDSGTSLIVKNYGSHDFKVGQVIEVAFEMEKAHFFDGETEKTIVPRIPESNSFDVSYCENILSLLGQSILLPPAMAEQLKGKQGRGTLYLPSNALREGGSDLRATVAGVECIHNTQVVQLLCQQRSFFMIGQRDYTPGEELQLSISFKDIRLEDEMHTALIEPLPAFDTLYGAYFDASNAKRSVDCLCSFYKQEEQKALQESHFAMEQELSAISLSDALLKTLALEHKQNKEKIQENLSYRLGTEDLGKEGKKKVKAEADAALAMEKTRYNKAVEDFKSRQAAFKALSPEEKQEKERQQQGLRAVYAEREASIKESFLRAQQEAREGLALVEEQLPPLEQQRADQAKTRLEQDQKDFAAEKEKTSRELETAIAKAKELVDSTHGMERDNALVQLKEARRAKKDVLAAMEQAQQAKIDDILFESKVFAAYIHGLPCLSDLDINKKIVKGLGAQLFMSHYRFELPHDGYVSAPKGMELKVEALLDYGTEVFACCSLGEERLFVKASGKESAGDTLTLLPDITKARIFENKFDIRLY